jgi:exopolysaccharide biosynthesis WecB/TagA/CpsF family protein
MKQKLYNIKLDLLSTIEVSNQFISFLEIDKCHTISFLNAHCFNISRKNDKYLEAINSSDLLLNDGVGIKIACILNGLRQKENLNGTDLIPEFIKIASEKGKKIFLLGGEEGIAKRVQTILNGKYSDVLITGVHSGFFSEEDEIKLIELIDKSEAEILILGMGVPKQELWAFNKKVGFKRVKVIISGGAILDFLANKVQRAPVFLRIIGMEWVYRLLQEPKRLANRYIIGNAIFLFTILWLKLKLKR